MEKTIVKRALERVAKNHGVRIGDVEREIEAACLWRKNNSPSDGWGTERDLSAEDIVGLLAKKVVERLHNE